MEKNSASFIAALKSRSGNKTLALYDAHSYSSSEHLKPQIVISTVSKQLRDIQKSDYLKKKSSTSSKKPVKSEFMPITVLSKQEVFHEKLVHKFEPQCVSDTQLIDIVDRVEAMVGATDCTTQQLETNFNVTSLRKNLEGNRALEQSNKFQCHVTNQFSDVGNNVNKHVQDVERICKPKTQEEKVVQRDLDHKKETDFKYMDDINTDICREFDTIYSETQDDVTVNSTEVKTELYTANYESVVHNARITKNDAVSQCPNVNLQNSTACSREVDTDIYCKEFILMEQEINCDDKAKIKLEENDKQTIIEIGEQVGSYSNDDIFNYGTSPEIKSLNENKNMPSSPIFNNYKMRRKSPPPLVFPLDSFEKFESLVLPLIENLDLEAASCLINSQIINKELVIKANKEPILDTPHNNPGNQFNKCQVLQMKQMSEVEPCKYGRAVALIEPTQVLNKSSNKLKHDIVFHNDVETGYVDKSIADMTCAFKTPFPKSVDLNKTIFLDFQESSRKSIELPEVSKSQSIFDNIEIQDNENKEKKLNELVDSYDRDMYNYNKQSLFNSPHKIISVIKDENVNRFTQDILSATEDTYMKPLKSAEFNGFRTVNGKYIDVTEKASSNSKSTFKDIVVEEAILNKKDNASFLVKEQFVGFKTASNKRINMSDEALTNISNIFKDIDLDLNFQQLGINVVVNSAIQDMCHKNIFKNDNNIADDVNFIKSNEHTNKEEHISIVDQTLLQEFENDSIENDNRKSPIFRDAGHTGFNVVCNKNNNVSNAALIRPESVIKLADNITSVNKKYESGIDQNSVYANHQVSISATPNFMGFKTANNKEVTVTKEALARTTNFFEDMDFKHIFTNGFNSNNKNIVLSSKDDILKSKDVINDHNKDFGEVINKCRCSFGKNLIFDHSLFRSNSVSFSEIHKNVISANSNIKNKKPPYPIFPEKRTDYSMTDNENNCTKCLLVSGSVWSKNFSNNNSTKYSFQGFKTASNKDVKISDEALLKTRNVFQDIDSVSAYTDDMRRIEKRSDNDTKRPFRDIDLLSNSNVIKNKENINIKHENSDRSNNLETPTAFQGFKTASNKIVKVSEKSLLKCKEIFQSMDIDSKKVDYVPDENIMNIKGGYISPSCQGFQIANNIARTIFEEAFLKSKDSLEMSSNNKENNEYHSYIKATGFEGFKTAENKPVKLSKPSIQKTKNIFPNIDHASSSIDTLLIPNTNLEDAVISEHSNNIEIMKKSTFQGFKTASNKQVTISENALVKTKNIFEDMGVYQDINLSRQKNGRAVEMGISNVTDKKSQIVDKTIENGIRNEFREFSGFLTANNKSVKISDQALFRARKVFDDVKSDITINKNEFKVNIHVEHNINPSEKTIKDNSKEHEVPLATEPKTAMNKFLKISDNSLENSRKPCADINNRKQKNSDFGNFELETKKYTLNVDSILNTQVINNFEETLHTKDFYEDTTPKQCRRSGSPILSCPKAKKRKKFETPYRSERNAIETPNVVINRRISTVPKYKFEEIYKINKSYTLKDLQEIDTKGECNKTVDPYILNFNFDTLLNFEFVGSRNDLTHARWTAEELKNCFLESVNKKIVPDGWVDNHMKLILWKLISYEIQFPNAMKGACTIRNILEQLKYRYDKELYNVQRPALRKLLEKDDVSTRTMVLAVVGVYEDGLWVNGSTNPAKNVELLLTDGWYCVMACTDKMISGLVHDGKIVVGRKIAIVGAELLNCEQGVSPWEDTSSVRLKIFGNSTRPARWDARLGYHSNRVILSQLSTIDPQGGKVCKMRALVTRVYPTLHVQRYQDGGTVTRSERLEHLHQMKYEPERQLQLEKLYEEVEKEFFKQELQDSEDQDADFKKQDGSMVDMLLNKNRDPLEYQSSLTCSQAAFVQDYASRKKEKILEELQRRVQNKIQEQGLDLNRNVVTLLKIRVAGLEERKDVVVTKAMISIWRPSDAILDVVKEGTWINMFNVVPTAMRNSEIQISAGRQSVFSRWQFKDKIEWKPHIESLKRKCYSTKELVLNPSMTTNYNEMDTFGIVFLIEPSTKDFETAKKQFQNVFLTDIDKSFICINFWGGIKKFGYDSIFDIGNIVACLNLQKRAGNTRKTIIEYRATELSIFTATPKRENVRKLTDQLTKQFSSLDKKSFCEDCVLLKNDYTKIKVGTENMSPYRFNTSEHNLTKNKIFIDSPLAQNKDVNFNLTGLDFESTFKQTDTQQLSPSRLKRKRCVDEKIAKLKMYGEPPPLSKIYIINKSNKAGSAYKSPLTYVTSDVYSVTRIKNIDDSPVTSNKLKALPRPILSTNRCFSTRSGVNPVKLNFSVNSAASDKVDTDPFDEEFECSPPLSLD